MLCGIFSDKALNHFQYPRNMGIMYDSDAEGSFGEPECGDYLKIYIKVEDNIIKDISFLVQGCVGAIASSSMITELAKNKTLEEAMKITDMDIVEALEGLPENKIHCSILGVGALKAAINNYKRKK